MRCWRAVTFSILPSSGCDPEASMARSGKQTCVRFVGLDNRTWVRDHASVARTRVRWVRVAAAMAAAVLSVTILAGRAGAGSGVRGPGQRPRTYVVREGDTLWAIARRL